ncbi:MAG: restriction endonuclease [Candidatus Zixiibacteriota bacterium]
MAEVTRKRVGQFVRKLTEMLIANPEGLPARVALQNLERSFTLTDYEKGYYESGGRRFEIIVRYATIDLVKAGWMIKQKGSWFITEQGKASFETHKDPKDFYREAVKLYHLWKQKRPSTETPSKHTVDSDETRTAKITFEQAEEQAWQEIQEYLAEMNPYDFQDLVASLLRAMGYHISWIAPPGKDGGIDILAWTDPLGTKPPRIKVQVKRVRQSVNVEGLRSFMAMLADDDVGIFVTTGGFTKDAAEEARTQEKRKVTLIDLQELFDLWVDNYHRLQEKSKRLLPLQPIYFLAPED